MSRRRRPIKPARRSPARPPRRPSFIERLRGWSASRPELGSLSRACDVLGLALIVLAVLTLLGLVQASTGQVLAWWAAAVHRLFGWVAYPLTLSVGLLGVWLVWEGLSKRLPVTPAMVVGLELLLAVAMAASHVPLVLHALRSAGSDGAAALTAADQGRGGGMAGWALATLLIEGVGPVVGAALLIAALALGLYLLIPFSWQDLHGTVVLPAADWLRYRFRHGIAAFNRWYTSRQGQPVAPELPEPPWWEREPSPEEVQAAERYARARRARSARPAPALQPGARVAPIRRQPGRLPAIDLLDPPAPHQYGDADVRRKSQIIEETLASFGVPAEVVEVNQGPTVTQFGVDPGYVERPGPEGQVRRQRVRVARIASLVNDLALALAASPIRIEAPVPGRPVVGIEVPNDTVALVSLRNVMDSPVFRKIGSRLAIALGEDVSGHPAAVDLGLMPHLLIAGATGSGKSVCINAIICCLLFNNTPEELKLIMVDPKMVELIGYNGIPHLVAPVIVETEQVVGALSWVTRQMDQRYKLFNRTGVRNLGEYNRQLGRKKRDAEEPLPVMVVLIDELADLMMVAPDEVERHLCRVAQMGRATGIHLVVATQRPSVDVVTGLIKANFPARISFAVTSQTDSRVILDQGGAENLLGRGDMLFVAPQQSAPVRLQGCFVSDKEIDRLIEFWRGEGPAAPEQLALPWLNVDADDSDDGLLQQAIKLAETRTRLSTSFVQRQLRIGFPRAARLMDELEEQGVVGPDEGAGRGREVLLPKKPGIDLDEIEERLPGVPPH